MNKLNIFIPAAGLGERLRPITDHIPKPLLPVLGTPAISSVLEKVLRLPAENLCINLHWKSDVIEDWLRQSGYLDKAALFHEKSILGTGGALKNAEAVLSTGTFLVHNSDIISDIDLEVLLDTHRASGHIATLAIHDSPAFNCLSISDDGLLMGPGPALAEERFRTSLKAFTGIAMYEPEFLDFLPQGVSSVVSAWFRAIDEGMIVGTCDISGTYWADTGTPSSYAAAVFRRLKEEGETIYIHSSVEECSKIEMFGNVVIEKGSMIINATTLNNCIILPGGMVKGGKQYNNCIVGQEFTIDLNQPASSEKDEGISPELVGQGGSDREYYRIYHGGRTLISMQSGPDDKDFKRHIELTRFFLGHSIAVPDLVSVDEEKMHAVFEDLGDTSLYNWLKCSRSPDEIEESYRNVIEVIVRMHLLSSDEASKCMPLYERIFDYEHFRWETGYFLGRFVHGITGTEITDLPALERELHILADRADSFQKCVIHRDFQSQNIMLRRDRKPHIIDYQGARIGPPSYDLASLLWDPYYRLDEEMRERLLEFYSAHMKEKDGRFNRTEFNESITTCRLQRHMQALGAYGFLSSVKGKKFFLKYIPEGIRLLKEDISLASDEYPELWSLVNKLD